VAAIRTEPTVPVPEPELTPREIIARAAAMRPKLIERQAETEALTYYPESTHQEFLDAGFYRILIPRRYGGYEFDVTTWLRVIMEIARGCMSTAWCLCLAGGHALQVGTLFEERAQAELFGEGDFRAASFGMPVGVAKRIDGGWELNGTWPYASGIPWSTHFMGQTLAPPAEPDGPPAPPMLFVAPKSEWTMLDDWGDSLGLKGSGSQSVRIENGRIPDHFAVQDLVLVDFEVSEATPGYRLHGNPMYAGKAVSFFMSEFGALTTGAVQGAIDEYERIITTRTTTWPPKILRSLHPDHQRHLGIAMGRIATAEAATLNMGEQWMELCRRCVEDGVPFGREDDHRLIMIGENIGRLAWDALQEHIFRTGGSSAARDGERLQRIWRDMSTYWSHVTPSQSDLLAQRLAMLHLDLPEEEIFGVPAPPPAPFERRG
jgi:3-hydroxy-9,10-secoandrosta-1,3,5(10)-triene-9,17-dione monooxygenase